MAQPHSSKNLFCPPHERNTLLNIRLLSIIVLILSVGFTFVLAGNGLAQEMQLHTTPQTPGAFQPFALNQNPHLPSLDAPPPGAQINPQAVEASATLGQPGLSFRYVRTFGVTEMPYFVDTQHLNRPVGLFMDGSNNLFVTEEQGNRVLKYNAAGSNLLALGAAGMCYTGDYAFCTPQDIALDLSGNLWAADGNRIVQYNASGTFLQQLPTTDPWLSGDDDTHFEQVHGIAFDSTGLMFVSDTDNQRIQVYDLSGGTPVYTATLGVTDVISTATGYFNSPYRLAVDGSDRLYVVDKSNNRVQRCTLSGTWTCLLFDSGLNEPQGIAVDGSDNVYIADTNNGRIRKCSSAGVCSDWVTGTYGLYDLAVDASGNVYGAAAYDDLVVKYNSSGGLVGTFIGVAFVPYLTDGYHYNHPRVAVDTANNLIVIEENGQRLTKVASDGTPLWSVGMPGVDANDNTHFNWPHGVAVDASGTIYVADSTRVQIFTSGGVYSVTLGTGAGTGNYEFAWVAGIAVGPNGMIYVSDGGNHRVQVYNSNRVYVATLGVTGVSGSDNSHFNYPIGVEVDAAGNLYVADSWNCRVQKFNSSHVYQMTFGTTGSCTTSFADVSAEDVTVDAQGRVYVSGWDDRVEVFDASGAYLTTLGGAWGTATSQFRGAAGVAVDSAGNVYIADFGNGRIQKFAPGVPDWRQANINGFGDPGNSAAFSLAVFNNQLYAGAANWTGNGASIWRTTDGSNWSSVMTSGFGLTATNPTVLGMLVFNSQLYAGTGWAGAPGQLWRSSNGTAWNQITGNGLGQSTGPISTFTVYTNTLYLGTCGTGGANGVQIWRSSTGNSLSWTNVVTAGNTTIDNTCLTGFKAFNNMLYAAVENEVTGAQIWRSATGNSGTWTQVNVSGFGSSSNDRVGGFAIFGGSLYIGTRNLVTGAQLWQSSNGTTWTSVMTNGFGDANNDKLEALFVYNGMLYAALNNVVTGLEVWRSSNGTTWSQINPDGFGNSNNLSTLWSNETIIFNNALYLAVGNNASGLEIWQLLFKTYLPFVMG
jgi:sugar lactone lactonase YvrE